MLRYILRGIVLATVLISPPLFFNRLYSYDWYRQTLLDWVNNLDFFSNTPVKIKILELGCGPGDLSAELAHQGHNVVGADRSERMIKRADKLKTKAKFVQADALHLPMTNNEFDAVILASLINLVPERTKLLEEIKRVLKPGCVVSVLFPTPSFNSEKAESISTKRNLGHFSVAALSVWAVFGKSLEPKEICKEFADAGFEKISTEFYLDNGLASVTAYKSSASKE